MKGVTIRFFNINLLTDQLSIILIGMILNETVDFAISTFALRKSRIEVVDFMVVVSIPKRGYIYVKNPKETFDWEVYAQPFWQHTWLFVILFSFIIPIFMMIILVNRKLTNFVHLKWFYLKQIYSHII